MMLRLPQYGLRGVVVLTVVLAASWAGGSEIKHRFLAKDESRAQLHYVNQFDPSQDWTIKLPKGCRDIQVAGKHHVLVSYPDGYLEYDLRTQKQTKNIVVKKGGQIESVQRMADGRTILAGRKGKITFYELDKSDKLIRTVPFEGYRNIRLFRVAEDDRLLFGANNDHVIEADLDGKVHLDIKVPGGKHVYWVRKLDGGKAYRVSTGYGASIVDITPEGKVLRTLGGQEGLNFFSRPYELKNGNIVCSHWTGHGAEDSKKGPQLIEYDPKGNVVWKWHDPRRAGTIHGVIVFEDDRDDQVRKSHLQQYELINRNIGLYHPSKWQGFGKVSGEAHRQDAMILHADKRPVDVILRRTRALAAHLEADDFAEELESLAQEAKAELEADAEKQLFLRIAALRRRITFSNPLLDFDEIVFLKHNTMARGDRHMVDQYLGVNQARGGGVYRLRSPFLG